MAMVSWIPQQGSFPGTSPGPFDASKYHAVEAGYHQDGAKLYIGRARIIDEDEDEGLHIGKIHQLENICYIPYEGDEHRLDNFEILSVPPGVSVHWVAASAGQVPPNAVEGGQYQDGSKTYIGRFQFNGTVTPGEIVPNEGVCYISFNGKEEESNNYEVLVMSSPQVQSTPPPTVTWISQNGTFDPVAINAFEGGCERNGVKLYIGRSLHDDGCHIGKVRSDLGACFVPFEGEEHQFKEYQVLTTPHGVNVEWVPASGGNIPPQAVEGGYNDDRSKTFVGRVHHDGVFFPGEIVPAEGLLYTADNGEEKEFENYDVLVLGGPAAAQGVYASPSAPPL